MGIATDTVIIGTIGTARVRDFTVLGTGVNLAAHLTRDARQGRRILVDKRTYFAVRDLVIADPGEEFELKKPDQPQGRRYERYCVHRLKDGAAGSGPAPAAASTTPASAVGSSTSTATPAKAAASSSPSPDPTFPTHTLPLLVSPSVPRPIAPCPYVRYPRNNRRTSHDTRK